MIQGKQRGELGKLGKGKRGFGVKGREAKRPNTSELVVAPQVMTRSASEVVAAFNADARSSLSVDVATTLTPAARSPARMLTGLSEMTRPPVS